MSNDAIYLNQRLFDQNVEEISVRDGFGEGLVLAADENPNIVVLTADLTESTRVGAFKDKYPERFFEVGVAEQNLVTVASGLASVGKIPFATSYAVFSPGRNWEQIRTTICYNDQPVKLIGCHAGISVGPDGATHQALEDIALMRVLPNMTVISPCDVIEAKKATLALVKINQPCYLRLSRNKSAVITTDKTPFEIGKAAVFSEGRDVTIVATGQMVHKALLAAKKLNESNISARVINCHTIKPLDTRTIINAAEETGAIVTIEDHQKIGGLGSAIAELLAEQFPIPLRIIGINDIFGESGNTDELFQKYNLTTDNIIKEVLTVLRMKNK